MIDHLVYGTPDLPATVAALGERFGFALSEGGRHLGLGTRNYLADLGGRRYLEVIGPDPEQPAPDGPRFFGVDELTGPKLVTWAIRVDDLERTRTQARERGYPLGDVRSLSRDSAHGVPIHWRMTPPMLDPSGLVPFVVEWGTSPHPAERAAHGARLVSLTGRAPDPDGVRRALAALGAELPVDPAEQPALRAVIDSPAGTIVLE